MATFHATMVMILAALSLSSSHPFRLGAEISKTEQPPNNGELQTVQLQSKSIENERSKRHHHYSLWAIFKEPSIETYDVRQPQYLQIKRPYFLPIWTSASGIPIYFRALPFYSNPGNPKDNPPKRFPGLPDISTVTPAPSTNETTTKEVDNKFGEDGPVWEEINPETSVRPTRAPRKPGQQVTHPPLVHKESSPMPSTTQRPVDFPMGYFRFVS